MFLKALTIKGFKSFAETANLSLEPGITVVVGPNGSGKSNVVDAMAWVLGAQAPTAVRSQKMDDVIFAGTASRKALGRAEVSLTIDNGDGELPIEFNEVTITRTLFRSGDSDYAINGVSCRLLDIQELLSDSGVGRQQHIIVSQGRIDDVLNAKPEDRRAIIEEAAGVLKYRKRKERAERRLAATEENLQRLQDLLREVRRQVRPLEKQAAAALRHGSLVAELTALKVHIAGQELRALRGRLAANATERRDIDARTDEINRTLATLDAGVLELEAELTALGASDIADVASRARSLAERIRGQTNVVVERRRRLEGELQAAVDDGLVANLEAESAKLAAELRVVESDGRALAPEFAVLEEAEARLSNEQLTFDTEWDDELAPKPTRAPELRAQLDGLAQAATRSDTAIERLTAQLEALDGRRASIGNDRSAANASVARLEAAIVGHRDQLDGALAAAEKAERRRVELTEERRRADGEASRWQARRDALAQALDALRAEAGLDTIGQRPGVLGALLDLVAIDEGWEQAVEAAAGDAVQAIVVDQPSTAAAALAALEAEDLAGAVLALGRPRPEPPTRRRPGASSLAGRPPLGATQYVSPIAPAAFDQGDGAAPDDTAVARIRAHVRGRTPEIDASLGPLLDALFARAIVVDGGWRDALDRALVDPEAVVVTMTGARFAPSGWRIGRTGTGATGAALAEADEQATAAAEEALRVAADLVEAEAVAVAAAEAVRSAEEALRSATAEHERTVRSVEQATTTIDQLDVDRARLDEQRREATQQRAADAAVAERLAVELPTAENEEAEYLNRVEALSLSRTSLEERAKTVSDARKELEVRAAAIEQRRELLLGRQRETEGRLERLVEERDRARVRREAIEMSIGAVDDLAARLASKATEVAGWVDLLGAEQRVQSEAARQVSSTLTAKRGERQAAERELLEARERRSRVEIAEAETKVKLDALTEALRRELDTEPEVALAAPLPPVGGFTDTDTDSDTDRDTDDRGTRRDRETEIGAVEAPVADGRTPHARVRDLERELKVLGPINPLALEEFEALKERHEFLGGQLDDVKTARKDLNTLIRSIDEEIVGVFSSAFADVATNFVDLFGTLFPGGQGGIRLTNGDDLLNCGIEIEAKPSGKNVKKLSLLSGGERSLVALAFLFAVFRSRPSPFYVMDEVEAALDDVNLSRFLSLVEEFRKEAQLIIVSHQKRTMEAADVLYGVTMKPGGSSKVVSEKVEGRRTGDPVIDLERENPVIVVD